MNNMIATQYHKINIFTFDFINIKGELIRKYRSLCRYGAFVVAERLVKKTNTMNFFDGAMLGRNIFLKGTNLKHTKDQIIFSRYSVSTIMMNSRKLTPALGPILRYNCHYFACIGRETDLSSRCDSSISAHISSDEDVNSDLDSLKEISKQFKSMEDGLNEITVMWPIWAENRFWLLGPDGRELEAHLCPTPDEAAILLGGLQYAYANKNKIKNFILTNPSSLPLVNGLVECLRLVPPRSPSALQLLSQSVWPRNKNQTENFKGKEGDLDIYSHHERIEIDPQIPSVIGIGKLSNRYISRVLTAMSMLAEGNRTAWIKEMDALCDRLANNQYICKNLRHIYRISWALSYAKHWTPQLDHLELAVAQHVEQLRNGLQHELSMDRTEMFFLIGGIVRSLVSLGYIPRTLLSEISTIVKDENIWEDLGESYKVNKSLVNICWAFALSQHADSSLPQILLRRLARIQPTHWEHLNLVMLHQFFLTVEVMHPHIERSVDNQLDGLKNLACMSAMAWEKHREKLRMISTSQNQVYNTLKASNIVGEDIIIESTIETLSVDIVCNDERLIFEVDGPSHFARNAPHHVLGSTLWKKRLLQMMGWQVINLPTSEWETKRGFQSRVEYIRDLITLS